MLTVCMSLPAVSEAVYVQSYIQTYIHVLPYKVPAIYGIFAKNGNVLRPYARPYLQVSTPVAKK